MTSFLISDILGNLSIPKERHDPPEAQTRLPDRFGGCTITVCLWRCWSTAPSWRELAQWQLTSSVHSGQHTLTHSSLSRWSSLQMLCFPARSPVVTQLQGISQKASHFHFQLRDQFQVFGGEIRTCNFLHPSQSSLVAMAKPSLLLGYNCRSRRGWCGPQGKMSLTSLL